MSTTQISVSAFKARCTALLRELDTHPQRIEVTNRGRVIAVVSPPALERTARPADWLGSLRGSVLRYEAPFSPAADPAEWGAARD
ncbi:MAG: hypothetical protein B9S27_02725 [Opitutia bacterium Tous-C8FEB]|nr:MAG: hypothetical protein B9S27_02725 [Opitutae bacterium Tous-C8FEB]